MSLLIIAIFGGILYFGAIFLLDRKLKERSGGSVSKDVLQVDSEIRQFDSAVEQALGELESMLPLDEALAKEEAIGRFEAELATEREKLQKLDTQVRGLQQTVEEEEGKHNELKKGKDEAAALAEMVRDTQEQLQRESTKLEDQLASSLAQVQALSGEISLTADQEAGLKRVTAALERAREQLAGLNETYTQASTRFLNLEHQYVELEKEFTKLVEKELSGKM